MSAPVTTPDDRIDRLINVDFGGRGIDHLYEAARARVGRPLAVAAAQLLAEVPREATVIVTTGSVSRAWVSPSIGENDGPAGAAAVARALSIALDVMPVIVAEATLLDAIGATFRAAGFLILSSEEVDRARQPGGRVAGAVLLPFPLDDDAAKLAATRVLDDIGPALMFSTERAGRNAKGIYHNARGRDYGMGRARVDLLFDEALRRGIPTVAVGDGGNEIGMGLIPEAVAGFVKYGDRCECGCGAGIGAVTSADVLVTAACSNWGCYGITAALAALMGDPRLLHTRDLERRLLEAGVDSGLINAVSGFVDPHADGIDLASHEAIVELLGELSARTRIDA